MSVALDICNSALIKLGVTPISDLDEDTKEARLCRIQYPIIRNATLRSAPWGFATRRKLLTPVDPMPLEFIDGGEFVFLQPVDCVKVWKLWGQPNVRFRVEGRYIIADDSSINLYYVSKATPEDNYDDMFSETVANRLAADLCYALVGSTTLKQGLEATADNWVREARSYNSQEGTPDNFGFDQFLGARTGGRAFYD